MCVCLLWCVLQFRTLKQSKIPVGEETQVQSAGGVTTKTSWCWQTCLCFSLSSPLCFLTHSLFLSHYFFSHLLFVFSSLVMTMTQFIFIWNPLLSTHRVSAVPSRCRCGSTSCVVFVVTYGRSFRQSSPRRCSDRCCQKHYSCWCKDMPGLVLHTRDTCKLGTLSCTTLISKIITHQMQHHTAMWFLNYCLNTWIK